jgi:hypothetical protein
MIAFERLAMLALGELSEADAAEVEEHVLGCDACAAVVERLVELGERMREVARAGGVGMMPGHALVEQLASERLVTRTYRIAPGGSVACTVGGRDIYSAMYLEVDLHGVRRLDLLYDAPSLTFRLQDLPFDPERGELTFVRAAEELRLLPTERKTIRLVSVEDGGDRLLGEYVLNHTAYRPE